MQTNPECITCIVEQNLKVIRRVVTGRSHQEAAMLEVSQFATTASPQWSPPYVAREVHRIIRRWSGAEDPYYADKLRFNRAALDLVAQLKTIVQTSADPFATAARIAVAGNIIDPSIVHGLDEAHLVETIERVLVEPLAFDDTDELRAAVAQADRILYLGDNAGEIVLDRLFIEELPRERITFVVRGGPVLNDALLEDAEAAGITRLVTVIDNGSDIAGTVLEDCSAALREAFDAADLVIAKGQGNFETLSEVAHPGMFFLLKVKCPVVARHIGSTLGGAVIARYGSGRAAASIAGTMDYRPKEAT